MTNTRSEALHWLLLPLAVMVGGILSGLLAHGEFLGLLAFSTLVTLAHLHYGLCVVSVLLCPLCVCPLCVCISQR